MEYRSFQLHIFTDSQFFEHQLSASVLQVFIVIIHKQYPAQDMYFHITL